MTPELLSIMTGTGISAAFNIIPGLKEWYDTFSVKAQKLAMVVMTGIAAVIITFWQCANPNNGGIGICLHGVNWYSLVVTWFMTFGPNQVVDRATPKPGDSSK